MSKKNGKNGAKKLDGQNNPISQAIMDELNADEEDGIDNEDEAEDENDENAAANEQATLEDHSRSKNETEENNSNFNSIATSNKSLEEHHKKSDYEDEHDEENDEEDEQQKSPADHHQQQQTTIPSVFMTPSSVLGNKTDVSPTLALNYSPTTNEPSTRHLMKKETIEANVSWPFYQNFTSGFENQFSNHYFNQQQMLHPISSSSPSYPNMKPNVYSNYHQQQQQQQQAADFYYNQRIQHYANSVPQFNNTSMYNHSAWSNNQYDPAQIYPNH